METYQKKEKKSKMSGEEKSKMSGEEKVSHVVKTLDYKILSDVSGLFFILFFTTKYLKKKANFYTMTLFPPQSLPSGF